MIRNVFKLYTCSLFFLFEGTTFFLAGIVRWNKKVDVVFYMVILTFGTPIATFYGHHVFTAGAERSFRRI